MLATISSLSGRHFSPSTYRQTWIWQRKTFGEARLPGPIRSPWVLRFEMYFSAKDRRKILLREFSYSFRSATIGSIDDALRAGTYPATSAAANKMATAVPRAHGSFRFMPNRNDSTSFDAVSAAGTLTAT